MSLIGPFGIIADGGGFTGAYYPGFRKALTRSGIKPVYYQGVSVGALNVSAESGQLEDFWLQVERKGPGKLFPLWKIFARGFWSSSLFGDSGLRWLTSFLNFEAIAKRRERIEVVAYNEELDRREIFSNHDPEVQKDPQSFREKIHASCALMGFLPCVYVRGVPYSDGTTFLIESAIRSGCRTLFICLNDCLKNPASPNAIWYKRVLDGGRASHMMLGENTIKGAQQINLNIKVWEEVAQYFQHLGGWRKFLLGSAIPRLKIALQNKYPIEIVVLRPETPCPQLSSIRFRRGNIRWANGHAYDVGMRTIEALCRS